MGIESPIELYQSSVAFNASIFFSKHKTLALVGAIFLFVITSWKDGIKIKALDRLINSIFLKDMPLTTWLYRDFNSTAGFEPTNNYVNAIPLSYILKVWKESNLRILTTYTSNTLFIK